MVMHAWSGKLSFFRCDPLLRMLAVLISESANRASLYHYNTFSLCHSHTGGMPCLALNCIPLMSCNTFHTNGLLKIFIIPTAKLRSRIKAVSRALIFSVLMDDATELYWHASFSSHIQLLATITKLVCGAGALGDGGDDTSRTGHLSALSVHSRAPCSPQRFHWSSFASLARDEDGCSYSLPNLCLVLPIVLDAFDIMHRSPALGSVLMECPAALFQESVQSCVSRWLAHCAAQYLEWPDLIPVWPVTEHLDEPPEPKCCEPQCLPGHSLQCGRKRLRPQDTGKGKTLADGIWDRKLTPMAASQISRWPRSFTQSLAHDTVTLQLQVIVVRTPQFFMKCVSGGNGLLQASNAHDMGASRTYQGEGDNTGRINSHYCTSLELATPHAFANEYPSYPCDEYLEDDTYVQVRGTVYEIYFAGRDADEAAPWITLLTFSKDAHGGYSVATTVPSALGATCMKVVDLRLIPSGLRRKASIVGEVVEVRGRVHVGTTATCASHVSSPVDTATEYVEADYVSVVLSYHHLAVASVAESCGVHPWCAVANASSSIRCSEPPFPSAPWMLSATSDNPVVGRLEVEDAREELAALQAVRCWEGLRLALGRDATTVPRSMDGELMTTEFFSISLDAVVGVLVALFSAQVDGGVSLVLLDEGTVSAFSSAIQRLVEAVPSAVSLIHPTLAHRANRSHFLPTYRSGRARHPSAVVSCRPPGTAGPHTMPKARVRRQQVRQISCANLQALTTEAIATVPPRYPEVIRAGVLSQAFRRTLVMENIEICHSDTLKLLRDILRSEVAEHRNQEEGEGGDSYRSPERHLRGTIQEALVRREGGQSEPYRITHSAICTVRCGAMLRKSVALVEFAQRVDIVVRPTFHTLRRNLAVLSSDGEAFQALLRERGGRWLRVLAMALALPHSETFLSSVTPSSKGSGASQETFLHPLMYTTPQLTETCSDILRSYFVAAKALRREAVDASIMKTLVKLTCAHAAFRVRTVACTLLLQRQERSGACRHPSGGLHLNGSLHPMERFFHAPAVSHHIEEAAEDGRPQTALLDAVVAIGLCDGTLQILSGSPILSACVFATLEEATRHMRGDTMTEEVTQEMTFSSPTVFLKTLYADTSFPDASPASQTGPHSLGLLHFVSDLRAYLSACSEGANHT